MNQDNIDNRKYPRAKVEFQINYSVEDSAQTYTSGTYDISATGTSFKTDAQYEVGTTLKLTIRIKEIDLQVPAKGVVVRNRVDEGENYVSLEFSEIEYDDFITLLDTSLAFHDD